MRTVRRVTVALHISTRTIRFAAGDAPDRDTVQNILASPAPPRREAKFSDIVGGDHTIWSPIYDLSAGNGDIYAFLLANAKP